MKRFSLLVLLPLALCALERVNLIKNASFEREDSIWIVESGALLEPNPAVGTTKDSLKSTTGLFSASADTREAPSWHVFLGEDSVAIRQEFHTLKKLADLDSLCWYQSILPRTNCYTSNYCLVGFTYADPERNGFGYGFINPEYSGVDNWIDIPEKISEDTTWQYFEKSLQKDFMGIDPQRKLASFVLDGWGVWFDDNVWRGQKVYWDDVRLMGYADYDVGVKEILSGDSLREGTAYKPEARIKNFGRENAPEFHVIAEVWEEETRIYYDSLPWSLAGDTEDIASFADFTPDHPASYILAIRTVMEPDESDEDDQLSKPLIYTGIEEPVTHPDAITLQVRSFTDPLCVSYSIPQGQQGTLTLYDAAGRRIERMNVRGSGSTEFTSALSSGVYFVRLETGQTTITKKAVVLR